MLRAIARKVSPRLAECQLTFVERSPIDLALAERQHDDYCATLEQLGVVVTTLAADASYPDSCFVEDTAIVVDELAIICSMGTASRRGETEPVERELKKYRDVERVSLPATIEGGDMLRIGKRVFVGQSSRTNLRGVEELARILGPFGYRVVPVKLKGSLHLKTACTAINDETLFVNPDWVELEAFEGFDLLRTPVEEPHSANLLRVGMAVCLQAGCPLAAELVGRVAERMLIVDTSELRKAEAGLTCSSIIFEAAS